MRWTGTRMRSSLANIVDQVGQAWLHIVARKVMIGSSVEPVPSPRNSDLVSDIKYPPAG